MDMYRIIPKNGVYKVEEVGANGQRRVVETWPSEEAAVSHLRRLQAHDERADRHTTLVERGSLD